MQVNFGRYPKVGLVLCAFELAVGGWLLIFAAVASFHMLQAGNSPTLLWLVIPMAALGVLIVSAAVSLFVGRITASLSLLGLVFVLSTVRWWGNAQYVFPISSNAHPMQSDVSLIMWLWQTQQFAFAVATLLLLVVTGLIRRDVRNQR